MPKLLIIFLFTSCLSFLGCETTNTDEWLKAGQDIYGQVYGKPLSQQEIAAGLKQALEVGTNNVVGQIGKRNGFYRDSSIHIPLPDNMAKVQRTLKKVGLSSYLDELELSLARFQKKTIEQRLVALELGHQHVLEVHQLFDVVADLLHQGIDSTGYLVAHTRIDPVADPRRGRASRSLGSAPGIGVDFVSDLFGVFEAPDGSAVGRVVIVDQGEIP